MCSATLKQPQEEEDESWISGEELRTEGSSDEDVSESRTAKKKRKTDALLKRLLVSSLGGDRRTSFLPSISKSDKVTQPVYKPEFLDEIEASLLEMKSSTTLLDSGEEDKPKSLEESLRRSLNIDSSKPAHFDKGETKSTNHQIFEMNEFYFEMAEQLRFMRKTLKFDSEQTSEAGDYMQLDPKVLKLLQEIEKGEEKVSENMKMLQIEQEERKAIQDEISSLMAGRLEKNERTFLQENCFQNPEVECKKVDEGEENKDKSEDVESAAKNLEQEKKTSEKDFIAKNKKLAKEYNTMSRHCLTDEEKIKLESLLSDIDENEEEKSSNTENAEVLQINDEEDQEELNGFTFHVDEEKTLADLEAKLKDMCENYVENAVENDIKDLEDAENKGKHWKVQVMQKRLRNIDTDLTLIQEAKNKESDELESARSDGEARENHKDGYLKSVEEMRLNIKEIEIEVGTEEDVE